MKKILLTLSILSSALLFNGCSSDGNSENAALLEQVQGKWQLIAYTGDIPEDNVTVNDGYIMELKSNKTFTSNEVDGYTGGKYSVINNHGKNIKLVFQNSSGSKVLYKYINEISENNLHAQYPQETPLSDEYGYFGSQILTRIP